MGCFTCNYLYTDFNYVESFINKIIKNLKLSDTTYEEFQKIVIALFNSSFDKKIFKELSLKYFVNDRPDNITKSFNYNNILEDISKYTSTIPTRLQLFLIDDFVLKANPIYHLETWAFSIVIKKNRDLEFYLKKVINIFKYKDDSKSDISCFKEFITMYLFYNILFIPNRINKIIKFLVKENKQYIQFNNTKNLINIQDNNMLHSNNNSETNISDNNNLVSIDKYKNKNNKLEYYKTDILQKSIDLVTKDYFNQKNIDLLILNIVSYMDLIIKSKIHNPDDNIEITTDILKEFNIKYGFIWNLEKLRYYFYNNMRDIDSFIC